MTVYRDNVRPGAASDVIFCVDIDQIGVGVCVKRGEYISNRSGDIRLPHFVTDERRTNERTTVDAGHDLRKKRHSAS